MKILWLVNIPLPEVSILMGERPLPYGGWLINASLELSKKDNIDLSITYPKNKIKNYKKIKGDRITYYAFQSIKKNNLNQIVVNYDLKGIIEEVNPELVHIFGTELPHTLAMVNVCIMKNVKTVLSIQGLVSMIEGHMFANLPFKVIYGCTLRNLLLKDNIARLRKTFYTRGKNEIEAIKKTNNIIGRTTWDKACTLQINSKAKYFFCNETLREEFYKNKWELDRCERNSIFLSQGQYSFKGMHYIIKAMPFVLDRFPDAKLYISGKNIIKSNTIKDKLLLTYYGKYIKKQIKELDIESNVIFTGLLEEKKMCERYLKTHVFVSASSIENSPNSLGEAMILGVPCIASYVGGIPDMLKHEEDGFLYQTDAPYMLAYYICKVFENDNLALVFSENARKHSLKTHDKENNTKRMMEIYEEVIGNEKML